MRGDKVVIRRARPKDGERVAEMVRELARHEGKPRVRMTAAIFRRVGFGRGARFTTFVAEAGGGLQGYAVLMPVFAIDEAVPGFYMDDLYVEPTWRKRGLGRMLMQAAARHCAKRGGRYVMWHVRLRNTRAFAFYDGIGAVRTDHNCRWVEGEALIRLAAS